MFYFYFDEWDDCIYILGGSMRRNKKEEFEELYFYF